MRWYFSVESGFSAVAVESASLGDGVDTGETTSKLSIKQGAHEERRHARKLYGLGAPVVKPDHDISETLHNGWLAMGDNRRRS